MKLNRLLATVTAIAAIMTVSSAQADQFRVTFENLQAANGFTLTPAWVSFHDGSFDTFDTGSTASAAIESLAELGDTSGLSAAFQGAGFLGTDEGVLTAPGGFAGAPVVEPGEISSMLFNTNNSFFSYASMIIPSNDTFIGNNNALAFDLSGLALGQSLSIDVASFYDAGTEINDPNNGAAFSTTGGGGAGGTAEGGVIALADLATFNGEFLNTAAANGQVTSALTSPFARFTITAVPEPSSMAFLGLFALAGIARRRRK